MVRNNEKPGHPAGRTPAIEGGRGDGRAIGEVREGGEGGNCFKEP